MTVWRSLLAFCSLFCLPYSTALLYRYLCTWRRDSERWLERATGFLFLHADQSKSQYEMENKCYFSVHQHRASTFSSALQAPSAESPSTIFYLSESFLIPLNVSVPFFFCFNIPLFMLQAFFEQLIFVYR